LQQPSLIFVRRLAHEVLVGREGVAILAVAQGFIGQRLPHRRQIRRWRLRLLEARELGLGAAAVTAACAQRGQRRARAQVGGIDG
jgi:hypothetical protein